MVTLQFAQAVRRCCRDDLTVTQIAERLHGDEAAVMATLRMLGLPLSGEHEAPPERPSVDVKGMKWQDYYGPDRR